MSVNVYSYFCNNMKIVMLYISLAIGQDKNDTVTVSTSAKPSSPAQPFLTPPQTSAATQPHMPPQTRTPVSSPPSVPKTPVAKLQEFCQQNNTALPVYKALQVPVGFRYTVTVRDREYTGEIKGSKQDARHSAAEVAYQQLDNSRKLECTTIPYMATMHKAHFL